MSNKFQWFFLKNINKRKFWNTFTKIIPFTYYCIKKGILKKIMSDLKAQDFVAMRTSCNFLMLQFGGAKKYTREKIFEVHFLLNDL